MNLTLMMMRIILSLGRRKARKKAPWIGKQYFVKREGLPKVETFLYEPKLKVPGPLPVLFNIHGGAWVGGDATALDTQSQQLADTFSCFVVNINYKKVDVKAFPYPQEEVRDVVLYFAAHADEFGLDKTRFAIIGYSAGGHLAASAAYLLKDSTVKLSVHIPVYPFLDFRAFEPESGFLDTQDENYERNMKILNAVYFRGTLSKSDPVLSPNAATAEQLQGLSPAEIILCGPDSLYQQGLDYEKLLNCAGIPCCLKEFPHAKHGFMESNYPEVSYEPDDEQRQLREECIAYIKERLAYHWGQVGE